MTTDEKLEIIARAILELSEKGATIWVYDGEDCVGKGITLPYDILLHLREIGEGKT